MKNYYEILEVNQNASDEIIKVAYKSLVKKYHPDLKNGHEKEIAEEKIKQINEAYDVLSDHAKRQEYDLNLQNNDWTTDRYQSVINENMMLKQELNRIKNMYNINNVKNHYYYNPNYNNINYQQQNNKNKNSFYNLDDSIKSIFTILAFLIIIIIILKISFISEFIMEIFDGGFPLFIVVGILFYIFVFKNKK